MNKALKSKDINKIKQDILNSKKTLLNLKFQKSSGQLEKTDQLKKEKKNIARLKTSLHNMIGDTNA